MLSPFSEGQAAHLMKLEGVDVAIWGYGARQRMRQRRTASAAL